MKKIFKYQIPNEGLMNIPVGAKILKAGHQFDHYYVWAEVGPDANTCQKHFRVCATGEEIPDGGTYIDTVFVGSFVWHVYEITVEEKCFDNFIPKRDHAVCTECAEVCMGTTCGIISNMTFPSMLHANFYKKHGKHLKE